MGSCWFSLLWPSQLSYLIHWISFGQRSFGGGQLAWAWWHMWMGLLTGKSIRPTTGDLPGKRSQLYLEPFGIGIPSGVWVRLPLISPFLRVLLKIYKIVDTHLINWYKTYDWCIKHVYKTMRSEKINKAYMPKEVSLATHLWGYACEVFWPQKK